MAQPIEESLFQAIKKDDIKAFNALKEKAQCGAYRLGRFPVLSLLYLYKSRRILSEYEQAFLKITNFEPLSEPVEVSKKFLQKAGKCLRLYLNEVVSPLEMLLILDKTSRLKRIYPLTKPSDAVKGRLISIYSIKYSLKVKFEGDGIIIDRRPLSYREKKHIATVCLCAVLGVSVTVGVPVTVVSLMPEPVEGEVKKFSQIDFASNDEYTLKRDIVIPDNYSVEKVNCKIAGGGYKLILSGGVKLGEFNGKLSDLTIESSGEALFTAVTKNAVIENVTVNVKADLTVTKNTALFAVTNYGTIDGVTLNVSGKITANKTADVTELTLGGIVQHNNYIYNSADKTYDMGTVKNCTVNYSQFVLAGEAGADTSFGGVAGINSAYLQDCTVNGEITADTCDIAGICAINGGLLSDNVNGADLVQTSSDTGWNPIVCGIVLSNMYAVENCENRGSISAVSVCGSFEVQDGSEATVSAAGIAYINSGSNTSPYIKNCANYGNVESSAVYRNAYAAGICRLLSGGVESCKNSGAVTANADNGCGVYVGGISAVSYGNISKSENTGAINASCNGAAYVGGICARSCASRFGYCLSSGDITVKADSVTAGGIFGISEVTSDYFTVYWGTADKCISECKIDVTATGESISCVGGIAGYVREEGFSGYDGSVIYCGGCVTNCYFTGEYSAAEGVFFGNIVGVCGANIYETNSSGNSANPNFDGNGYIDNTSTAFGKKIYSDDEFAPAEDKGATAMSKEDIKNSQSYLEILSALEK